MKHLSSVICLFLLTVSMLSACGDAGNTPAETQGNANPGTETAAGTSEPTNADLVMEQVGAQDFGGYEFRVVSRDAGGDFYGNSGPQENELFYEAESGDVLHDAIYRRNQVTEELLNITIKPLWSGSCDNVSALTRKSVLAGDDYADAVIERVDFAMNIAAEHLLLNFYDIPTVNLKNAWWDQTIISNFTMFSDQLYALCGDIVYFDDYGVQALYGNTRLMTNLDLEIPYQAVRDGTWTFDKFSSMVKEGFADLNGDGKIEREVDQLGMGNHEHAVLHMVYAFDQRLSVTQEDGTIAVNFGGEEITDAVTVLTDFIASCEDAVGDGCPDIFKDGRMMFFPEMIGGISGFRDMEDDYCVLPMPKWDESQENYTAYVSNGWSSCYVVPTTVSDANRTGTILEVMSAVSADTVTPALYDIMLNEKYVRDAESQEMLSYIWASKAYDLAGDLAWASDLRDVYSSLATSGKNNFTSQMEKRLKSINKKLENFLAAFTE